jgi:hypothetical protein
VAVEVNAGWYHSDTGGNLDRAAGNVAGGRYVSNLVSLQVIDATATAHLSS